MLFTVVPSELYVDSKTLDTLHEALAADYLNLFNNGLEARVLFTIFGPFL